MLEISRADRFNGNKILAAFLLYGDNGIDEWFNRHQKTE